MAIPMRTDMLGKVEKGCLFHVVKLSLLENGSTQPD